MNYVAWVLILLCAANFLSGIAHEGSDSEMPRSKDFLISTKKLSLSDQEEDDFDTRKTVASENIHYTEKAQRGKGSYGGANVVHRRPGDKSAALLCRPCFCISSIILGLSFLLFPFHYLQN